MNRPTIIALPKITENRGNISFIEQKNHIPFEIKQTFCLADLSNKAYTQGHAYKESELFIVALRGSFDVILDSGTNREVFHLNRPNLGLYIPKLYWIELNHLSTDSFTLILSSKSFDKNEYITDYEVYKKKIQ